MLLIAEKTDYQLTEAEAAVLKAATEEALAAAGGRGGAIGGGIGGAVGGGAAGAAGGREGGASGGRRGGRLGARLTKAQTAEATVDIPDDPEIVRERATTAIAESGAVIEDPNAAGDGSVWGIVPSGAKDMMPALVRVQVEATNRGAARVRIRASGREGLIKQKIGAKAADRIAAAISHS
jgi:hypothetical protein